MTRVDLGAMGGCDARTQGASNAVAFDATEDTAACPPSAARRLLLHSEAASKMRRNGLDDAGLPWQVTAHPRGGLARVAATRFAPASSPRRSSPTRASAAI